MNDRSEADPAKRPKANNRVHKSRGLRRLFYYGSSALTGVLCGLLLGNGWSRQPVILVHSNPVPAASPASLVDTPLTPPQAPALDGPSVASGASEKAVYAAIETDEDQAILASREPMEPPPPPPSEPFYIVQVGAFDNANNAARAVSQFKAEGFLEANMVKIGKGNSRVLYRVYIARFSDETRAKAAAKAFRIKEKKEKRGAYAVRYQASPTPVAPTPVSAGQR